jgi:TRAP transporter TAXI family solute receptor
MPAGEVSRRAILLGALTSALGPLAACTGQPVHQPSELVLATGPPGAVFREIGGALAEALASHLPHTHVIARPSGASVENLRLLADGAAQLAFAALDAVLSPPPTPGIAAVGRLYDSFLHLVVPAASPVNSLAQLEGRTVSLGTVGSGTEFTAGRLLLAREVRPHDVRLTQADSAVALGAGHIDAFFTLSGIPTPAITTLGQHTPVRLVPLPAEANALASAYPGMYDPAIIPATTYEGVAPCPTVTVPNLLLARSDLPDDVVETVTATVFTDSDRIAVGHPEARRINVRTGIATGPVPLHPGAQRWFRSAKR